MAIDYRPAVLLSSSLYAFEVWDSRAWKRLGMLWIPDHAGDLEELKLACPFIRSFDLSGYAWFRWSVVWTTTKMPLGPQHAHQISGIATACDKYVPTGVQAAAFHVGDPPQQPIGLGPGGFMVTSEKGFEGFYESWNIAAATAKASYLLASPPQRGAFNKFVRVVKDDGSPQGLLLGQWIWSNGAWCHQGGPWSLGPPPCTGVYPPKPTYPAYQRNLAWRGF